VEGEEPVLTGVPRPWGGFHERVLIVDGDPAYRDELASRLRSEGAETAGAASGEEALKLLGTFEPTLVIAELAMSGMDALELSRRIRAEDAFRRLPILIMTSAEHSAEIGDVVGLGLIWYMRKGAAWRTIMRSLRNLAAHNKDLLPAV